MWKQDATISLYSEGQDTSTPLQDRGQVIKAGILTQKHLASEYVRDRFSDIECVYIQTFLQQRAGLKEIHGRLYLLGDKGKWTSYLNMLI